MLRSIGVLAVLAVPLAAAPVPKALKAKVTLDGRWELVEQNYRGQDQPNFAKWMWVIDGEKLSYCRPDGGGVYVPSDTTTQATLTRPHGGKADEVDYATNTGKNGIVYKCVIALSGDELVVCFGSMGQQSVRPSEPKAGPDLHYFRFKRATDK